MYQIFDKKNNLIHEFGENAGECVLDGINNHNKSFENAVIKDIADFENATFERSAYFIHTTFESDAIFLHTTFEKRAYFIHATFENQAYFTGATFESDANFIHATFENQAHFIHATFAKGAYFTDATFEMSVYFTDATFERSANFTNAKIINHQLTKPSKKEWQIVNWVLSLNDKWQMKKWHSSDEWKRFTRENMNTCDTAHCLAGGAQAWASDENIRVLDPQEAGELLIPNFQHLFFMSNEMASLHIEAMRKAK